MPYPYQFTDRSQSDANVVAWHWDFGDGNESTSQNPLHEYADQGTYSVTLTATNDNDQSDSKTREVVIEDAWEHTFDFTVAKHKFDATYEVPYAPSQYTLSEYPEWIEGDGFPAGPVPYHVRTRVRRVLTSEANGELFKITQLQLGYNLVARGEYSEAYGGPDVYYPMKWLIALEYLNPTSVYFFKLGESGEDNSEGTGTAEINIPLSFYDNPNNKVKTVHLMIEPGPEGVYSRDAPYIPYLFTGIQGEAYVTSLHVEGYGLDPFIGAYATFVEDGLEVQFTDTSVGTVTARHWDFGDGNESTSTNPLHEYAASGEYTVTYTVTIGGEEYETIFTVNPQASYDWESIFDFTSSQYSPYWVKEHASNPGVYSTSVGWTTQDWTNFTQKRECRIKLNISGERTIVYIKASGDYVKGTFTSGSLSAYSVLNEFGSALSPSGNKIADEMPADDLFEFTWVGTATNQASIGLRLVASDGDYSGSAVITQVIVRGLGSKPSGYP